MGWSIGGPDQWGRDVGYGVPAYCDHPKCNAEIDRGLSYVCCESEPYGGDNGCGLYFCEAHRDYTGRCARCARRKDAFKPKSDHPTWIAHKLKDPSWKRWRAENKVWVLANKKAQQSTTNEPEAIRG